MLLINCSCEFIGRALMLSGVTCVVILVCPIQLFAWSAWVQNRSPYFRMSVHDFRQVMQGKGPLLKTIYALYDHASWPVFQGISKSSIHGDTMRDSCWDGYKTITWSHETWWLAYTWRYKLSIHLHWPGMYMNPCILFTSSILSNVDTIAVASPYTCN